MLFGFVWDVARCLKVELTHDGVTEFDTYRF